MDYSKFIVVSGKSGVFKIITQTKTGIIAESLSDSKKIPIPANSKVTSIEDIVVFTESDEVKLKDIFKNLKNLSEQSITFDHKSEDKIIKSGFETILPNYDKNRVYVSDMKKIIMWFNQLNNLDLIIKETEEVLENTEKEEVKAE